MENKYIIWAATANAVNKDTKAMIWLRKITLLHMPN